MNVTKEEEFMNLLLAIDEPLRPLARHFHTRVSILEAGDKSRQVVWSVVRWIFVPGSMVTFVALALQVIKEF